ncbi:hypothetical protein [Catalinimonas alkaloidigena]|nr:hypothetical protein [Catalinimonas alkaloidigena]
MQEKLPRDGLTASSTVHAATGDKFVQHVLPRAYAQKRLTAPTCPKE